MDGMLTKLDPVAAEVAAGLTKARIPFHPTVDGGVRVMLPGGFGEFEISALDNSTHGDSICALVDYNWHSHDEPLELLLDVFAGRCLLIEQHSPNANPTKYITYDLGEFVEVLPKGGTYKVFNLTAEELERRLSFLRSPRSDEP